MLFTYLNKAIGDNVLVLELDARIPHQSHDGRVVHEDVARVSRARYCLTLSKHIAH